jgi:non-specific serine/threonine protein kinase
VCGRLLPRRRAGAGTSREPLRIAGETRYRLGPLTLPEPENPEGRTDQANEESEAVTLFADRARQVEPNFVLDTQTRTTVAQLVARLDGMPLAIELAAARVDALGVPQLLDRIGRPIRAAGGRRPAGPAAAAVAGRRRAMEL